jgi:hypothetical protein
MGVEIGIALAGAAAVALLALYPARLLQYFPAYHDVTRHLPGRELEGPDPIYKRAGYPRPTKVDTGAIRRGGELIPDGAVYYFQSAVSTQSVDRTSEDTMLAARLFFLPAVRSQKPNLADWILSYRVRPSSSMSRYVYTLDRDLHLTRRH